MRRQRLLRCALVRFVHDRCGVSQNFDAVAASAAGRSEVLEELAADDSAGFSAAVRENRPAVIRSSAAAMGVAGHAGGPGDWLPRLRELCGHREVMVRLPQSSEGEAAQSSRGLVFGDARKRSPYAHAEMRRLDTVLDELLSTAADGELSRSRPLSCYVANVPIEPQLPELHNRLAALRDFAADKAGLDRPGTAFGEAIPGTPVLYLGAGGQQTPLHFDPTENLSVVLQGSKHFRLFPPSASTRLRPKGGTFAALVCWWAGVVPAVYSEVDAWAPMGSPEGPLDGGGPAPLDVVLQAGEILYLPSAWWHSVIGSPEANMTVVFGFAPCPSKGAIYYRRWLPF
eukprot:gnl/TRDRNA2_/TRDRNA2_83467_c0_seq1.p1 gnl/TRDRNA2_/TRDRNA2_83467_c0~~gnl/TRDRNA2_/TRDRNA2_83467_c0_seq1.p1  ORF type:complete len:342 (-),score=55.37 gnl/TRDRNA2_/TRDRNA2_83467_c0_seq1:57-1082(-)